MQEILKKLAVALRGIGFRGSGQNYRKTEGDFIFVINFQGSTDGRNFFVNLGAQPTFIPAECHADLGKLKEYECVLRRRVGEEWAWQISDKSLALLESELLATQSEFFGHAQTMRASFAVDSPDVLLQKFTAGTTDARAALHLARVGIALGCYEKAHALATRGMELAGEWATILRAELRQVLEIKPKSEQGNASDKNTR